MKVRKLIHSLTQLNHNIEKITIYFNNSNLDIFNYSNLESSLFIPIYISSYLNPVLYIEDLNDNCNKDNNKNLRILIYIPFYSNELNEFYLSIKSNINDFIGLLKGNIHSYTFLLKSKDYHIYIDMLNINYQIDNKVLFNVNLLIDKMINTYRKDNINRKDIKVSDIYKDTIKNDNYIYIDSERFTFGYRINMENAVLFNLLNQLSYHLDRYIYNIDNTFKNLLITYYSSQ